MIKPKNITNPAEDTLKTLHTPSCKLEGYLLQFNLIEKANLIGRAAIVTLNILIRNLNLLLTEAV